MIKCISNGFIWRIPEGTADYKNSLRITKCKYTTSITTNKVTLQFCDSLIIYPIYEHIHYN
jgi:hypothetical protein